MTSKFNAIAIDRVSLGTCAPPLLDRIVQGMGRVATSAATQPGRSHWRGSASMQRTKQPKYQQDDNDKAKHAPQAAPAISAMGVVAAAAAEEEYKNNDDYECCHMSILRH
ncbi:hypothetical protein ABIE40_006139 [Rhizobium sp. OAE497]|jgi:hypothetical protein